MSINDKINVVLDRLLVELFTENPVLRSYIIGYNGYLHQAELVYKLLLRNPIRAFIADEIGLGKTIETLLLLDYVIRKKMLTNGRVLILVPRSLIGQWKKEAMKAGFSVISDIDFLDESTSMMSDRDIFIFKIDTVKQSKYKNIVLRHKWGFIVVDEAHKLGLDTKRMKFVEELLKNNPKAHVIFLSATPHRGDQDQYLKLISLLDYQIDARKLEKLTFLLDSIIYRRSKDEVNKYYEKYKVFVDASVNPIYIELTKDEEIYLNKLDELTRKLINLGIDEKTRRAIGLVAAIIDKRGLSSPQAGLITFERLAEKTFPFLKKVSEEDVKILSEYLEEEYFDEEEPDHRVNELITNYLLLVKEFVSRDLNILRDFANKILFKDSKTSMLTNIVNKHISNGEKVIVFTEYIDTAEYIYKILSNNLKNCDLKILTSKTIKSTNAFNEVNEWLSKPGPRVLISTDIAAEGLNLQYANVLVNYELPWSLIKLEQRTGRVWRIGQTNNVTIYLLILNHGFEKTVFESLYNKLSESIRAGIIPSILVAIKGKTSEELSLPVSMLIEDKKLTPFKIWIKYKTEGAEGVKQLVEEYIESLRKIVYEIRKSNLYDQRFNKDPDHFSKLLNKTIGFKSRDEINESIKTICSLYTDQYESREIDWIDFLGKIRSKIRHEQDIQEDLPIYVIIEEFNSIFPIFKTCVNIENTGETACWILGYYDDEVISLKEIISTLKEFLTKYQDFLVFTPDKLENIFGIRGEIEEAISNYSSKIKSIVRQEVIPSLLSTYFNYLEHTKSLRKESCFIKPTSIDRLELNTKPLIVFIPKNVIGYILEKSIEIVAKEPHIHLGEINKEKLDKEEAGKSILINYLTSNYELIYVGDLKTPFDFIARNKQTNSYEFIELKTIEKLRYIILTDHEQKFIDRLKELRDGAQNYWIFIVDLREKEIRGYRNPIESHKLIHITNYRRDGKEYYVYIEEKSKPDYTATFSI